MKAMFAGFAAIVVIAVGANMALNEIGYSSQDRATGAAVRLDE